MPPPKPAVAPLRVPTKAAPLKVLVAGDSMTEFLGPDLINQASAAGKATGNTVTKYGTGLVRPDFFDWSIFAQQLVNQQNPEAVVVMMGGNDGQGITLANGQVLPDGTDAWAKEYRRRVEVVMRIFSGNGKRRVYWIPMPVPRSPKLAVDYHLMDLAVADAAAVVPGVTDVNIVAPAVEERAVLRLPAGPQRPDDPRPHPGRHPPEHRRRQPGRRPSCCRR